METQKYSVNQYLIETLLGWVRSGEIAIPEIQRPFVWEATQVRDLLDSLYQGFPIGYIIVWKNQNVRLKDGSFSEGKKVLIDGQQRITALSAALVGQSVINKEYKTVRIKIAFNPKNETFEVSNPAIQKNKAWIPDIHPVIEGEISLLKLIKQYTKANPDIDEEELEPIISRLSGITKKQIGMIKLAANLDIETVTEIFIRINREGVTLSQADFAMSKIAANELHGGNHLRKAIDYFCHLAVAPEFYGHIEGNDSAFAKTDYFKEMRWLRNENDDLYDPSYSDMLRVAYTSQFSRGKLSDLVALLSGRNFETKTYDDDIAKESFAKLKSGVLNFTNKTNFKRFLMIIQSAGFIDSSLINAQSPMNFAYTLFLKLRSEGYAHDKIESYVRCWYVLSLLTSRYSSQIETTFEEDISQVHQGNFGDYLNTIENAVLSDSFWEVGLVQVLNTSNSKHPAFLTYLASQARDGVRGLLSNEITVRSMLEYRGDVHHIFPKDYLKNQLGLRRSQYNQVANYAYTQQETNIAIGKKPPQEYIKELKKQCESGKLEYGGIADIDELKSNFSDNAVPIAFLEGKLFEYVEFCNARRSLMSEKLKNYYFSLRPRVGMNA